MISSPPTVRWPASCRRPSNVTRSAWASGPNRRPPTNPGMRPSGVKRRTKISHWRQAKSVSSAARALGERVACMVVMLALRLEISCGGFAGNVGGMELVRPDDHAHNCGLVFGIGPDLKKRSGSGDRQGNLRFKVDAAKCECAGLSGKSAAPHEDHPGKKIRDPRLIAQAGRRFAIDRMLRRNDDTEIVRGHQWYCIGLFWQLTCLVRIGKNDERITQFQDFG